MARIRTIKPEFFRHDGLQDLEMANPDCHVMLVFSGLWTIADREGRFEWRPRMLKLDILPFLPFSMDQALELLASAGFIERYEVDGREYGAILEWDRHQIPGRDEPPSEIPSPDGRTTLFFRPLNGTQRLKVYERDKFTCVYCGREMSKDRRAMCLDHVIPYVQGGTNRAQNLATACKKCNAEKGARTPEQASMRWPVGLGEYIDRDTNTVCQHTVNPPLTVVSHPPDKEGEREGEGDSKPLAADDPADRPSQKVAWCETGFTIPEPVAAGFKTAYPAVDVKAEIARAHAWVIANPKNRKSNWGRFLNGWLQRCQDRAPAVRNVVSLDPMRGVL